MISIAVTRRSGPTVGIARQPVRVIRTNMGVPGRQGPKGDASGMTYTQTSASATWTINHNLGYRPIVAVADSGGREVDAEVIHASENQTIINFVVPTAGTARFN